MEIINNPLKIQPTAGDAYGEGWKIMWQNFVVLLAVAILHGIISAPSNSFRITIDDVSDLNLLLFPILLFGIGYGVFISGPIGYSTNWVFLKAVRGEPFEIKDMFAVFNRNYWNAVVANLVVMLIIMVGMLMLIVPGIIFACRLAFVPFLVIDREMELTEALSKSWEMTKGYGWQVFLLGFLAIFIVILGLIALFVGVIVAAVWIQIAYAVLYQAVVEKEKHFEEEITLVDD